MVLGEHIHEPTKVSYDSPYRRRAVLCVRLVFSVCDGHFCWLIAMAMGNG